MTEQAVSATRLTTCRKRRKRERTRRLELDGDQQVQGGSVGQWISGSIRAIAVYTDTASMHIESSLLGQ